MNENRQTELEIRSAFEKYLSVYFKQRNPDGIFAMMGDKMTIIGTANDEVALNTESAKELYLRDILQVPDPIDYEIQRISVQTLAETVGLVSAVISIKTGIGSSLFEMEGLRLSTVFKKSGNEWLIVHKHISTSAPNNKEGESYPLEELKIRNLWLEKKIREKTKGLTEVNLQLELDIAKRQRAEQELRESNELLSLYLKHSPIYSFIKEVTPTESKVLKVSDNFVDMTGIPGSEMVGMNMFELFPAEFASKITADDWSVVSGGKPVVLLENLNGHSYSSIKFPITKNGVKLLAGYIIDITERKQAETEIKEKNEELQQLIATKDKFFSIIAHDLKSPFNAVIGFSDLLLEQVREKDNEGIEEYAQIIHQSSKHAMDLLKNLMEWSRSQTGRMDFHPEYFGIVDFINGIFPLFNDIARQKSITIQYESHSDIQVFADKAMISTVIRNLISNAVKFSNPYGTIVISDEQDQNGLTISVKDCGIGISKERIEKLFHIDGSHSTPDTNNELGTGLGLILCKEFIEKHNGRICVESKEGEGSCFSFMLPLK